MGPLITAAARDRVEQKVAFEAMQGFHAGWRKSGVGGADGRHGLEAYLQTHVAYLQFR